jgi:hypothetical protein
MPNGENLTRNFQVSELNMTRGAQPAVYLRGLENLGVQLCVVFLQGRQFQLEIFANQFLRTFWSG